MSAGRAWDLHLGCVYCGRVSRDLSPDPSDPRDLACRSCLDLDAGPSVVIAGVVIPAAEIARPDASVRARARAVVDLVTAEDASPLTIRREGREIDRAVARLVRDDAADACARLVEALRRMPIAPCGAELDELAEILAASHAAAVRALRWEQGRAEVRSMTRRGVQ